MDSFLRTPRDKSLGFRQHSAWPPSPLCRPEQIRKLQIHTQTECKSASKLNLYTLHMPLHYYYTEKRFGITIQMDESGMHFITVLSVVQIKNEARHSNLVMYRCMFCLQIG